MIKTGDLLLTDLMTTHVWKSRDMIDRNKFKGDLITRLPPNTALTALENAPEYGGYIQVLCPNGIIGFVRITSISNLLTECIHETR